MRLAKRLKAVEDGADVTDEPMKTLALIQRLFEKVFQLTARLRRGTGGENRRGEG